ncbi:MAG: hypothetical protein CVU39_18305 [Chloroflexi bacterium HGW-Chloroflexi-10]|nr:MAG: hypothetical protein CVU39_18305 [Chloroflexi bacterium HGW-Chloroflexi-10]
MDQLSELLASTVLIATPLIFILISELLIQKSGMINFGQNGAIVLSAVMAVVFYRLTENLMLTIFFCLLIGVFCGFLFALGNRYLFIPQLSLGFSIAIFGRSLAVFVGTQNEGLLNISINPIRIPLLEKIPLLGEVIFAQNFFVYLGFLAIIIFFVVIKKSRLGLYLKGLSESPHTLIERGIPVRRIQIIMLLLSGALSAFGGLLFTIMLDGGWRGSSITFGEIGWFVIILVFLGSWSTGRCFSFVYIYSLFVVIINGNYLDMSALPIQVIPLLPQLLIVLLLFVINIGNRDWFQSKVSNLQNAELEQWKKFILSLRSTAPSSLKNPMNREG